MLGQSLLLLLLLLLLYQLLLKLVELLTLDPLCIL
jgi:hypothetical protein